MSNDILELRSRLSLTNYSFLRENKNYPPSPLPMPIIPFLLSFHACLVADSIMMSIVCKCSESTADFPPREGDGEMQKIMWVLCSMDGTTTLRDFGAAGGEQQENRRL